MSCNSEGSLPIVAPGKPSPSSELSKARRRRKRVLTWSHLRVSYLKRTLGLLTWHPLGLANSLVSSLSTCSSTRKSLPRTEGKRRKGEAGRDVAGTVGRCLGGGVGRRGDRELTDVKIGVCSLWHWLHGSWARGCLVFQPGSCRAGCRLVGITLFGCKRFTACSSLPGTKRLRQHSCASVWNGLIPMSRQETHTPRYN